MPEEANQNTFPPAPASRRVDQKGFALAAFLLGMLNLFLWVTPFCGAPFSIIGLLVGVVGMRSSRRWLAISGMILSGVALLLTIFFMLAGSILNPGSFDVYSVLRGS